jgi:hypothetical protein
MILKYYNQIVLSIVLILLTVCYTIPHIANADDSFDFSNMSEQELLTHVRFINIDSSIKNSTDYWIYLALDGEGKQSLMQDIDNFSTTYENKTQMKQFLESLWEKYPVIFTDIGNSTNITFSMGSNIFLNDCCVDYRLVLGPL